MKLKYRTEQRPNLKPIHKVYEGDTLLADVFDEAIAFEIVEAVNAHRGHPVEPAPDGHVYFDSLTIHFKQPANRAETPERAELNRRLHEGIYAAVAETTKATFSKIAAEFRAEWMSCEVHKQKHD